MSLTWNPTDDDEMQSKKAFNDLCHSVDKVVIASSDPTQPNRFILRSKGYFYLQAYISSGKKFPTTYAAFDTKFPESAFEKLSEFDNEIYDKTRETMVAVGSTCLEYDKNHITKLVTAGQTAIQYSDNTIDLLETPGGMNLRHHLDIVLDEKYTSMNKFDDDYRDAKEAAKLILKLLSDDATKKQKKTDEITQTLIRLKEDTLKNQPNVQFLIQQYKTGPVKNNSNKKTPYLEYLNKELADNLLRFEKLVEERKKAFAYWEKSMSFEVYTYKALYAGELCPLLIKEVDHAASAAWRKAWEDIRDINIYLQPDRKEETDLIMFVNTLINQCTDIDRKMDDAITAMTELSQLFSNQSDCYDRIASSLERMKASTDTGSLANRKAFIQYQMEVCIKKLKELKVVAQEFTKSVHTQITL